MATNSVSCTIVGHAYAYGSIGDYNQNVAYAGCAYGAEYYAYYGYVQKFTIGDFLGASESINFTMLMSIGIGTDVTLRYALCSSDANKNSYVGTKNAVVDQNQIVNGTFSLAGLSASVEARTITVPVTGLQPNTTYYLMLWASNDTGVSFKGISSAWGNYSTDLDYNSGLAWIGDDPYQCYVRNGSNWDLCIPHVRDGADWHICS